MSTPTLAQFDFDNVFEIECDASHVGIGHVRIGVVQSQEEQLVTYFNEKLNEAH